MAEDEMHAYNEAFKMFDKNDDGHISAKELRTVMQSLGMNPTKKDIEATLQAADIDGNGTIEFNEFMKMMQDAKNKHPDPNAELEAAFKIFDKDGNNKISAKELQQVMTQIGEKLTEEEVQSMLELADIDNDGYIDRKEFCDMMRSTGVFNTDAKEAKKSKR